MGATWLLFGDVDMYGFYLRCASPMEATIQMADEVSMDTAVRLGGIQKVFFLFSEFGLRGQRESSSRKFFVPLSTEIACMDLYGDRNGC